MFLLTLALLVFATPAHSAIPLQTSQGLTLVETYSEEGQWMVDEFLVRPGKIQQRQSHRVFDTREAAYTFVERLKRFNKKGVAPKTFTIREAKAIPVWEVKNAWSLDWEHKYSQWVDANFDATFMERYNLATDCADVAYTMRWIFARMNALPAAGTLAATGVVVTQDDGAAEWANLPTHTDWDKDLRFRAALKWLLNNVYTRTLWKDGYPLAIRRDTIHPGTIDLLGGHTLVLHKFVDNGRDVPISFLSSTVPQAVRALSLNIFLDSEAIDAEQGGLMQFRWPVKTASGWLLTAKQDMPHYSLEQYNWKEWCEGTSFAMCVYEKLEVSFQPKKAAEAIITSLNELIKLRISIVEDGIRACATMDCTPGSVGYEDWSTPSRDKRLLETMSQSTTLIWSLSTLDPSAGTLWTEWQNLSTPPMTRTHSSWFTLLGSELISYDPRVSRDARWGQTPSGIEEHVSKKWADLLAVREVKLAEASACRDGHEICTPGEPAYTRLNTIELDRRLRKIAAGYGTFCLNEKCPTKFIEDMDTVWFMGSQPFWPIELRRGQSKRRDHAQVFYNASQAFETNAGELVIGNSRVFNPKEKTERMLPSGSYLRVINGELLKIDATHVSIKRGDEFFPIYQRQSSEGELSVTEVYGNYAFIAESGPEKHVRKIINIKDGSVYFVPSGASEMEVGQGLIVANNPNGPSQIRDIEDSKDYYLSVEDRLSQYAYSPLARIRSGHYLFWTYSMEGERYRYAWVEYKDGKVSTVFMPESGWANTFLFGTERLVYSSGTEVLYSNNEQITPQPIPFVGVPEFVGRALIVRNQRGAWVGSNYDEQLYIFKDLPVFSLMTGHIGTSLFFLGADGFHEVDQDGTELGTPHRYQGEGSCGAGIFSYLCVGDERLLLISSQPNTITEALMGDIPFSYDPESYFESVGAVRSGSLIRPMNGVLIYIRP